MLRVEWRAPEARPPLPPFGCSFPAFAVCFLGPSVPGQCKTLHAVTFQCLAAVGTMVTAWSKALRDGRPQGGYPRPRYGPAPLRTTSTPIDRIGDRGDDLPGAVWAEGRGERAHLEATEGTAPREPHRSRGPARRKRTTERRTTKEIVEGGQRGSPLKGVRQAGGAGGGGHRARRYQDRRPVARTVGGHPPGYGPETRSR